MISQGFILIHYTQLADGLRRSLYLDFYEKGKRWTENLNLSLVPECCEQLSRDIFKTFLTAKHHIDIRAGRDNLQVFLT